MVIPMGRDLKAYIDLDALQHNLQQVKNLAPQSKILAMVKANGYGHGLQWAAEGLARADAYGVACIEEALVLRQAKITKPIVLLEGFFTTSELQLIAEHQLQPVIHHPSQVSALITDKNPICVWLKVNTGMHRLGFHPDEFLTAYQQIDAAPHLQIEGVMTHFACADALHDPMTSQQIEKFKGVLAQLPKQPVVSMANSAGVIGWPDARVDWVRPGLMLYGVSPFQHKIGLDLKLKPAMRLQTRLIAKTKAKKGDSVGYTGRYRCPEDMEIGVLAVGYADGYPVGLPDGTPVLLNGQRVPLVGRVSMDMAAIDLRLQPDAQIGDPVVLWGGELPVEEIATQMGTIPYELLTNIGIRVQRECM